MELVSREELEQLLEDAMDADDIDAAEEYQSMLDKMDDL